MNILRSLLLLALFTGFGFSAATVTTIDLSNAQVTYLGKVQATVNTVAQQDTVVVNSAKPHTLECVNSTNDWYYRTTDASADKILVKKDQVIDIPINSGTNTFYVQRVSADGAISGWVTK